jgi:hypothetical protein
MKRRISRPRCFRNRMAAAKCGAAVELDFRFFGESLFAIDGSQHAVEIGTLGR